MNLLPPASDDVAARQAHPYAALTPDLVMDALSSVGLQGDGRLTALSSYENRVYQVHLEDPHDGHGAVVAKFYRPERWSEAQIQEEHAFAGELAAAEIPVVAPLVLEGSTLHRFGGFAFSDLASPFQTQSTSHSGSGLIHARLVVVNSSGQAFSRKRACSAVITQPVGHMRRVHPRATGIVLNQELVGARHSC